MSNEKLFLKFTCTDRLNETKSLESELTVLEYENKKEFNKVLIENLKQFQTDVNTLMTEFVEKEKQAVANKQLSNEHLKNLNQKANDDEDSSSDEETNDETKNDQDLQSVTKRESDCVPLEKNSDEPAEKKICSDDTQ